MRKRLVINAEISQFDFLKNKSLNGDTETLKIIFEYFKSKKFIINIIITEKVWTKKDYNFRKEFENLKNKGVIEDFIFIDLKNSTHEKKPNNFLEYLKIKYTVKKEVKLYSYKFSNIINHIKPDFVFSFMDIFPVNYKSISPLVVWGLHNSDFVLKYNFEKKKRNFLHKQIFKLKLKINNYFYRKKVRGISLNLCPSQYFGKMNSILFKNRPKVIYFNHPARDLKKNKPVYKKKKQKIVSLIGTTQTTFAQANIDFLIDELLTKYNDELDEFEFHIVGDCSNPSKKLLTATKKFRNIKICGYVDDLFDKIISSDVILHAVRFPPTSGYKLPNICSCHPCLLLHKAAFQGFPEIFKNKACLSALSGKEFVGKLKILTKNKSLSNKIRQNARKVYEKYYSLDNLPKILENCNNMIYKKNETYKDWN